MLKYDAEQGVDKKVWLHSDESERIEAVLEYHKKLKIKTPNIRIHAIIHQVVENQLAEGIEPVQNKLVELMADGLSRHNAVHAIATALTELIFKAMEGNSMDMAANEEYFKKLATVTAKSWLSMK